MFCAKADLVFLQPVDLTDVLPPHDYEFRMGIRRGDPGKFFRASEDHAAIVAERQHWLSRDPGSYAGLLPGGEAMIGEVAALCEQWGVLASPGTQARLDQLPNPWMHLLALGGTLEPDLLLLAPGNGGSLTLQALCVCFPSSWSPADKLGHPLGFIHAPAPGLNRSLGSQIDTFLSRLQPGVGWMRTNWGLSASDERNQHPARDLPRLGAALTLNQVWLRVERQCLVALPASKGVLFGIRIESIRLNRLRLEAPEMATRLAHALRTMPEEIARYKGISPAREALATQLAM